MYLHLGQNTVVWSEDILGVFDLDNSTVSPRTRDTLARAQKQGNVINVSADQLPKSFVLCVRDGQVKVVLSPMTPATLLRRQSRAGEEFGERQ